MATNFNLGLLYKNINGNTVFKINCADIYMTLILGILDEPG
jgi:hypothetical protein